MLCTYKEGGLVPPFPYDIPYSKIIGWEDIVVKSLPQRIGGEIFGKEIFGECHFK